MLLPLNIYTHIYIERERERDFITLKTKVNVENMMMEYNVIYLDDVEMMKTNTI